MDVDERVGFADRSVVVVHLHRLERGLRRGHVLVSATGATFLLQRVRALGQPEIVAS